MKIRTEIRFFNLELDEFVKIPFPTEQNEGTIWKNCTTTEGIEITWFLKKGETKIE